MYNKRNVCASLANLCVVLLPPPCRVWGVLRHAQSTRGHGQRSCTGTSCWPPAARFLWVLSPQLLGWWTCSLRCAAPPWGGPASCRRHQTGRRARAPTARFASAKHTKVLERGTALVLLPPHHPHLQRGCVLRRAAVTLGPEVGPWLLERWLNCGAVRRASLPSRPLWRRVVLHLHRRTSGPRRRRTVAAAMMRQSATAKLPPGQNSCRE